MTYTALNFISHIISMPYLALFAYIYVLYGISVYYLCQYTTIHFYIMPYLAF